MYILYIYVSYIFAIVYLFYMMYIINILCITWHINILPILYILYSTVFQRYIHVPTVYRCWQYSRSYQDGLYREYALMVTLQHSPTRRPGCQQLDDQAASIMTLFPIQSHYPVTELTNPCPILIIFIKGQFLSYHAYIVWEVKDPLSQ